MKSRIEIGNLFNEKILTPDKGTLYVEECGSDAISNIWLKIQQVMGKIRVVFG